MVLISCGSNSEQTENTFKTNLEDEKTINTTIPTTSTTPTSTSTTTTILSCTEDDNTSVDFEDMKNVQNFLNRYGFNAGDEDGYLRESNSPCNKRISKIRWFKT